MPHSATLSYFLDLELEGRVYQHVPRCVEPAARALAGAEEAAGQDEPEPGVGGAGGVLQGEDQPRPPHPTRGGAAEQGQRGEGEAEECGPQLKGLEVGGGVLQGEDQPRPPHPTRGGAAEQGQRGEGEAEEKHC